MVLHSHPNGYCSLKRGDESSERTFSTTTHLDRLTPPTHPAQAQNLNISNEHIISSPFQIASHFPYRAKKKKNPPHSPICTLCPVMDEFFAKATNASAQSSRSVCFQIVSISISNIETTYPSLSWKKNREGSKKKSYVCCGEIYYLFLQNCSIFSCPDAFGGELVSLHPNGILFRYILSTFSSQNAKITR